MAPANPSISTMLGHLEKDIAPTLHLIAQVKSPTQAHHLHHWLPHSPSHQKWPTLIDPFTLLLYSRKSGSPTSYPILIPRYRFSYTPTSTTIPSPPSCSVHITVTHWLPIVATTHFFSKHQTSALNLPTCMPATLFKEP